jgi:hypothetical protein
MIWIDYFWLEIKNRAQSTQRLCALQSTIVVSSCRFYTSRRIEIWSAWSNSSWKGRYLTLKANCAVEQIFQKIALRFDPVQADFN